MTRIKGFYKYGLVITYLLVANVAAEELTLNINVKKPISVVSEKFLSITLDPVALFNTNFLSDVEKSTNMARALAPAYVRIGGPRSNSYVFERGLYPQETHPDPGLTFTETQWINLHLWAERSGLNVVACIAPQMSEGTRAWDPRNALDLISFSDHMGYNTSWQLGYECQSNCDINGADLGRDVVRLRSMLDAFPRFAEAGIIVGPDIVSWRTKQEQQYLQEYFSVAATGLSALTWHPDFAGVTLEDDGVSMHYDNLATEKDSLYKVVGRQVAKKPLWLAESKSEDCKRNFLGALVWARRLGNSAKLGAQVLMRQLENSILFRPTPDFWVSLLHKMLVGREVLDTKISSGNRTHIHFYAQCTKPSSKYEKGSITIFGLNLTPTKVAASLKGLKIKTVHKYVLLPGYDSPNRMFAESVLLNNDLLSLINGREIPEIKPIIYNIDRDVKLKLPSGGIGFWVVPGLKAKSCMGSEDDIADRNVVKRGNKRHEELEVEDDVEPGDDNTREVPDVPDSLEDRRSFLRHQLQRRLTTRRNIRHRDIDRDDERNLRRGDGIKRDVRKYEKIGIKKEQYDDDKSGAYITSDEKGENLKEAVERKMLDSQPLDSGEEIRAKLHEYKRRLADHEYHKKQRRKIMALTKERVHNEPSSVLNKSLDTGKVIEALTLITKVESTMKGLEKNNDAQQKLSLSAILDSHNASDVNSELKENFRNDELLDEVLNTEKAKRTAIPTKIEDQLKALYQLLSEEKKDASLSSRHRRDLDKRIGDDPLGLRRDSIFLQRRTEAKERRNERRQRIRERIEEHRRERENTKKMQRDDSGENNFYGFQYRTPLKNFPEGDLYLKDTTPLAEHGNAPTKSVRAADENADVWLIEADGNHMPNEFYENVNQPGYNAKEKEFGELWEAEALYKDDDNEKNINGAAEYEIVTERQLTEAEDRKAKEKAVQQLINYYETAPQEQTYDFEQVRQKYIQGQRQQPPQVQQLQSLTQMQSQQSISQTQQPQPQIYYQPQLPVNYQQVIAAGNNLHHGSYYYPNQYPQQNRRAKRDTNDIENLLHQEMIDEDDNNLKDCQCRVIRGIENCKDCQIQTAQQQIGMPLLMQGQIYRNPNIPVNGQKVRTRRDAEEFVIPSVEVKEVIVDNPEMIAVIPEGVPEISETVSETLEIKPGVNVKDEIDKAIAPTTLDVEVEPSALVERSAVDVELTIGSSKEDIPDVVLSEPVTIEMNLEAEEDEPLGSRVTRKTDSAKFFRKKSKVSTTTVAPKKKTKTNQEENTAIGSTTDVEGAKRACSAGEGANDACSTTLKTTDPAIASFNASNQPFNSTFFAATNQPTATIAANQAITSAATNQATAPADTNQATATSFITTANQPLTNIFTGFTNQATITSITGATNQSPTTGFLNAKNQPFTTTFTRVTTQPEFINTARQPLTIAFASAANQPELINTANQPFKVTFTGNINPPPITEFISTENQTFTVPFTSANAEPSIVSVTENKNRFNAQSYDSITTKTDKPSAKTAESITKNKDRFNIKTVTTTATTADKLNTKLVGTKATVPISNESNQSNFQATAAVAKRQSTIKTETTEPEKMPSNQTAKSSFLNNSTTTERDVEIKNNTSLQIKKLTTLPKTNNTAKLDELIKARHARLTTRTEALAALRKENENRRAKKMIEASLKLLESESARFAEYEKRRREQLDRLKDKLRAKREKMLNQYKDELIEAINNGDQKQSNLRRRDLVDGYTRIDEESEFFNYSPIIEMRSLHDNLDSRQTRNEEKYFFNSNNNEYEKSGKAKRSMPLYHSVEDEEEIYHTSAGDIREAFKRSPMIVLEMNNKPQIMEGDSGEYYTPEQQRLLEQRVTEAQRRIQQRQEEAKLHQHSGAQEQYPQVQYPYFSQMQYPYPSHMQQPYPSHVHQSYLLQANQIYPPHMQSPYPTTSRPYMSGLYHTQHYPQSHHDNKNSVPLNAQYNQPPQAMLQQTPVYPPPPISTLKLIIPPTIVTQQQTDSKQHSLELSDTQQQQPFIQQPSAVLHNQQSSALQQASMDYYNQYPEEMTQQPDTTYYNYTPTNTQQEEFDVNYTNQAYIPSQKQLQKIDYYNLSPTGDQQYYYPSTSMNSDYYKQFSTTSQQQVDTDNKNLANTQQVTTAGMLEQTAIPQRSLNPQPIVLYQQSNVGVSYTQQPTRSNTATDQSKQTTAIQKVPGAHLYEQIENTENLQDLKVYQPAPAAEESVAPYMNSYYQYYQNLNQQPPDVNQYEVSPTTYKSIQQVSASQPYKKAKRSNLKVLEINPSIYDDDDSDYNLHELFMKPSSRFSSRSSRSPLSLTDNKRHKRDVSVDKEEDGPLSIPLDLDLLNMMLRENNPANSDIFIRKKRQTKNSEIYQGRLSVNKNIKKVYKSDNNEKHKNALKRLTRLKRIDNVEVTEKFPMVRKLQLVEDHADYFPSIKEFTYNNLDENKDIDTMLTRRKRSPNPAYDYGVKYNHINRNEDSDMNEIWNDIIEMKHDEALDEYDKSKDELFSDFIKDQKLDNLSIDDKKDSKIQKVAESTTKVNIESMIVEAIPKLENVITGSIEKAQNLTGNFEDFIENFDEQFDETTANIEETSELPEDINNGRLSHGVFKSMIGGVKKFFNFISGITKIFHNY
ncbi:uncharacterized protein LOC131673974 [Phymastichus coffea]|uniref:uncharacterized protein LOC131673974 n=1 Tax=Phymastichus coffea TaxID=108790 RepID=UPI00273C49E6|nr:uncharacterized protein LOC131673974 [Phymastichus coffea]